MHLEVREREGEALGADVRAMWEARVFLFSFRPKSEPPEHCFKLVAQETVAASPGSGISGARVSVITLWVIPLAPSSVHPSTRNWKPLRLRPVLNWAVTK